MKARIPKPGQWCVVEGFNLREGPERWLYTQVLEAHDTEGEAHAAVPGPWGSDDGDFYRIYPSDEDNRLVTGPVKFGDWFHEFDGQLWLVVLDPDGNSLDRTRFKIPGRQAS